MLLVGSFAWVFVSFHLGILSKIKKARNEKKERERKEKEKIEVRDCGRVLRVY